VDIERRRDESGPDVPDAPGRAAAERDTGPAWSIGDPAMAYAASFVFSGVVGAIWIAISGQDEVTLGLTVASLFGQWVGLLGGTIVASRRRGSGNLVRDLGMRIERRDIGIGLVAGIAAQLVILPLLYLPIRLLGDDLDVSESARELTGLGSGAGLALLAVCIVVGAPLVEELFFRGLLQRTIDRRYGPTWAVAGSSVLFGVTHFQLLLLPGLIVFGIILGVLAQRRGRLGASIIAHMAFNAVTVIVLTA